jgi:Rhodopirellula transposase DDE domain
MAKATTKTGLEVSVNICTKTYATGRKIAATFKEQMRVIFDEELSQWNYRIPPSLAPIGEVI